LKENEVMNVETFWELIDTTREASGGDTSKQADLLVNALVPLSLDEIFAFETIWDDLMDFAYDAAPWDAAYIIGCGCGDDGFWEFRAWLIAQGKEVYEKALADPESLVDLIEMDKDAQEGALIYVVMTAYEQKTGKEMPIRESKVSRPIAQLKGTHWGEEHVNSRFPKLAAKFGDCEQRWAKWL
jgi:hypothetical protein